MDRLEAVLATIRAQADEAERTIDKSQQLATETERLRVRGESTGGDVRVTVDGVGQLVDLEFVTSPASTDPLQLSARVLEASRTAKARLTNEVARLGEEILGPDSATAASIVQSYTATFGREEVR